MRFLRTLAPAITFLCVLATSAYAQNRPPRFEVFAEGGGSFLNGGNGILPCPAVGSCIFTDFSPGSAASASFSFTARVTAGARFRFTPRNSVEASYSFSPNQFSIQQGALTSGPLYKRVDLVSFNFVRYLWAKTPIQPFTTAGLGLNPLQRPLAGLHRCRSWTLPIQYEQWVSVRLEFRRWDRPDSPKAFRLAAGTQGLRDRPAQLHYRDESQHRSQRRDCLPVQVRIHASATGEATSTRAGEMNSRPHPLRCMRGNARLFCDLKLCLGPCRTVGGNPDGHARGFHNILHLEVPELQLIPTECEFHAF